MSVFGLWSLSGLKYLFGDLLWRGVKVDSLGLVFDVGCFFGALIMSRLRCESYFRVGIEDLSLFWVNA